MGAQTQGTEISMSDAASVNTYIVNKVLAVHREIADRLSKSDTPETRDNMSTTAATLTLAYYIEKHGADVVQAIYSTGPQ